MARDALLVGQNDAHPLGSEIDLIRLWWERGGYQAESESLYKRQNALDDIAGSCMCKNGLKSSRIDLKDSTVNVLHELLEDEVIRDDGSFFRFSHDIFFEWCCFYYFSNRQESWIEELAAAGEPPLMGRVVELLSQASFSSGERWLEWLIQLETSSMRTQWQRVWLTGPFGAIDFAQNSQRFTEAIAAEDLIMSRI